MRWNRDKFIYLSLLFIIISVSVLLTFRYIGTNLSSPHPQKYQRVVGPAMGMAEAGDPFRYVNILKVNPTKSIPGYTNYPHLPFMEIGLASFVLLSPFSIHVTTHIFANILGTILLLLFFYYTYDCFDDRFAILSTAFLSVSYYMNLLSLLTVQDTVMFIFFFSSLITLEKYWKDRNVKYLTLAGLLAGLGFNAKYSLALILLPMTLVLFYYKLKTPHEYFSHIGFFYTMFIVPELIFRLFIQHIPSSYFYFLLTILSIVLLAPILRKDAYLIRKYRIVVDKILHDRLAMMGSLVMVPFALIITFFSLGFDQYLGGFITIKPELLFNIDIYYYMLIEQIKPSLTNSVFYIGLFGAMLTPLSSLRQYEKVTLYSFILGTLVYWILAMKPIFFHTYYKFIFGVSFSLLSSVVLYEMTKFVELILDRTEVTESEVLSTSLVVLIVFLLTFSSVQPMIKSDFSGYSTEEAANYLHTNTDSETLFLSQNGGYILSIPANRKSVDMPKLTDKKIRRNISRKGFATTMHRLNIKYVVTRGPLDPTAIPNPNADVQGIGDYREKLIKHTVVGTGEPSSVYYESNSSSFGKKVEKSLELEKEIQDFYFYRIKEPANSSVSHN